MEKQCCRFFSGIMLYLNKRLSEKDLTLVFVFFLGHYNSPKMLQKLKKILQKIKSIIHF